MTKTNQKTPTAAIVFYAFAVFFLLIFAFNIYYSYDYLSKVGEISYSEEWAAVLSIYFGQCVPSLVGALACYGFGFVIVKLQTTQNVLLECIEDAVSEDNNEDFLLKKEINNKKVEVKPEVKAEKKVEEKAKKPTESAKKKNTDKKADKKADVKKETVVKEEVKPEVKEEVKPEVKEEVKTEEVKETEKA